METKPAHTTKPKKSLSRIIGICVVLLVVIMGGLYFLKSYLPQKSPSNCTYNKDVCIFLSQVANPEKYYKGPFTASITTTKPDKSMSRVIIRSNEANDMDIIYYKGTKFSGESIIIGNTQYIKNIKTNTWTKSPTPPDPTILSFRKQSLDSVNKTGDGVTYTFTGTNKCSQKTCMTYAVKTPDSGNVKTYIFFTQTTRMLKQLIVKQDDGTTITTLFVYSPVTIKNPLQ